MDWLRSLIEQFQMWWQGLSPGVREGIVATVIGGIILGILGFLWKTGWSTFKKLFFKKDKEPPIATKEEADGQQSAFLKKVGYIWQEYLENYPAYQRKIESFIPLRLTSCPKLVKPDWEKFVPRSNPKEPSSSDQIYEIFEKNNGRLLILGKAGAGKTILLITLLKKLITKAEEDIENNKNDEKNHKDVKLPVILNLASWPNAASDSLDEWIIRELRDSYGVPEPLARYWAVEHRKLILLLDGLDEMADDEKNIASCIHAINNYIDSSIESSTEIDVKIVVTSRWGNYKNYFQRNDENDQWELLNLNEAVLIRAISDEQRENYFGKLNKSKVETGQITHLLEHDEELRRLARMPLMLSLILEVYGNKDVALNTKDTTTPTKEQRSTQLFNDYVRHVFSLHRRELEHLWPPSQVMKWLRWIADGLIQHNETEFRLENLQPDWLSSNDRRVYKWMAISIFGLIFGLVFGLVFWLMAGLMVGLFLGLDGGALGGFIGDQGNEGEITPVVRLQWSLSALIDALRDEDASGDLFSWLGLERHTDISSHSERPNMAIWRSGQLGLAGGLFSWLAIGLGVGLFAGLFAWLLVGVDVGLLAGLKAGLLVGLKAALLMGLLFGGLIGGLLYGGDAFIRHWALRLTLWRYGHTPAPWQYVTFLDYAVQRILLRRVGGGWIFIHRMIMEHIAQLDDAFIDSLDR